ncbi:putative Malectin domain-containing protein [Helianthus annuus]|nr:putative Malectin domain-containing protein [Helianthus annuus]KAJ0599845.1 putative Malectin domain-containing protein [Helianthus annuus]KAJ0934791.1 putative Malectin domain-containing protein [Helianthus annuus]
MCLRKGSYKVRLHFAEISYTNEMYISSLGRRYFDISIQGALQAKDFNIVEKANSVGRGIFVDFDNVMVDGSTLEIHLCNTPCYRMSKSKSKSKSTLTSLTANSLFLCFICIMWSKCC